MDGQNFNKEQNTGYNQTGQSNNYTNYQDNVSSVYQTPVQTSEAPQQTNALAIVSLVLGILSIVCMCCGWVGILFGIAGILCAVFANKQGKTGLAKAGMICSIVGLVLSVVIWIAAAVLVGIGSIADMGSYY